MESKQVVFKRNAPFYYSIGVLPWTPGSYAGMSEAQKRFANINPIIMAKCGGVIGLTFLKCTSPRFNKSLIRV